MELQDINRSKRISDKNNEVVKQVEVARKKLLDLTMRNSLLNFRHSERTNNQVRIIDSDINEVFSNLLNEKSLGILSLPPLPNEPKDEQTSKFQNAFNLALVSDAEYLKEKEEFEKLDEIPEEKEEKLIRELKNRVREKLGLPSLKDLTISKQEWAKENGINPNYDVTPKEVSEEDILRRKKVYLQTLLYPKELKSKMSGLKRLIKGDKEEKGTNTFYIAFGFLEWTDQGYSERKHYAPLLLLKLSELQQTKKGDFFIESSGDSVQINISLREKMKDFSINIPNFNEEDTPESYLDKIKTIIKEHPSWKVRNYVTIGRFIFSRLAMYEDLALDNWPGFLGNVDKNELLSSLFNSRADDSCGSDCYDIDRDEDVRKFAPVLITSADSSQHSAIVDAIKGVNLVIKGPPGTGKSQTITNLIANALYANKSVLFISEKKAALDVVYSRLQTYGLGDYCLELHSDKTKITNIRAELEKSLDKFMLQRIENSNGLRVKEQYRGTAKKLLEKKEFIRAYYDLLQENVGNIEKTLFDVIWAAKSLEKHIKSFPASFQNMKINNTKKKMQEELEEEFRKLNNIEDLYNKFIASTKDIRNWDALSLENVSSKDIESIVSQTDIIAEELTKIVKENNGIRKKNKLAFEDNLKSIIESAENIEEIYEFTTRHNINYELLGKLDNSDIINKVSNFSKYIDEYNNLIVLIGENYKYPEEQLNNIKDFKSVLPELLRIVASESNVAEVIQLKNDISLEISFWNDNYIKLANIANTFYGKNNFNINEIIVISKVVELLSNIDSSFISYLRNDKIFLSQNSEILKNISESIESLINQQTDLKKIFDLELAMGTESQIKKSLQSISTAGFFSFLNSDYREANKFYKYIVLDKKEKGSNKIDNLRKLLTYLIQKTEFENNNLYKDVLGCYNEGIKTNILSLLKVNNFYKELNSLGSIVEEESIAPVKSFFMKPDIDNLSNIINISQQIDIDFDNLYFNKNKNLSVTYKDYNELLNKTFSTLVYFDQKVVSQVNSQDVNLKSIYKGFEDIQNLSSLRAQIRKYNKEVKAILDKIAQDEKTKTSELSNTLALASLIERSSVLSKLHKSIFKNAKEDIKNIHNTLQTQLLATNTLFASINDAITKLGLNIHQYFGAWAIDTADFQILSKGFKELLSRRDALYNTCAYKEAVRCSKDEDFSEVILNMLDNNTPLNNLSNIYGYLFYRNLANIYNNTKWDDFRPDELGTLAKDLRRLDDDVLILNRELLAKKIIDDARIPQGYNSNRVSEKTELQLIKHQISGHARSIPLRNFLYRAGKAVQALKPCFLMSPISVAQYIAPRGLNFDLLIIDEASQMYFEEALGAVLRCKQLVVVGDEKQLPPTPFFQKSIAQEDEFDEDDEGTLSILETCTTRGFSARELLWHYRSKDAALIAFSNKNFYNDKLKLFPSSLVSSDIQGIQRVYVNGIYNNKQNEEEADAIIKAIKDFVRKYPNKSLGIATMNTTQKMLIEQKIDQLTTSDPCFERYLEDWDRKLESFFVKNLENVQGDERDFIFVSTVYGPETKGGKVLQRFGPINGKFGHRRLNVLFTRAKYGLKLFTSMKSDDIVVAEHSSEGVKILKNYLLYAETRRLDIGETNNKGVDSYFEQMVKELLESKGYVVDTQVGVKGFFIDLAIKHPKNKSYYALGIECDGAPYHSSKSARDRDCIRQSVLESLGWKIHRIWSKDWFFNTEREIDKLLSLLKEISNISPEEEYVNDHILADTSEQYAYNPSPVKDLIDCIVDKEIEEAQENLNISNADKNTTTIVEELDTIHYKRSDNNMEKTVQIVFEASDFENGLININTPLALALLGSEEGEEVEVNDYSIIILGILKYKRTN